jgi:hypothetical protein
MKWSAHSSGEFHPRNVSSGHSTGQIIRSRGRERRLKVDSGGSIVVLRTAVIGATAPFRGRLFQPVDDDPALAWQGSASMETTVTTTENPAALRQRDPWNKGRLERRCRCLKINLTLTSGANTGYPHPLPSARGRPERALRLCPEGRP